MLVLINAFSHRESARIRLFGSIDQNASDGWVNACGRLIPFQSGRRRGAFYCRFSRADGSNRRSAAS